MTTTASGRKNRLADESSPYLLLHASNPVDWYAWGDEAFEKARREDKPIFLSVGYSTCYWCHVMERECFSNEAIAAKLNDGFVSIKLDREERPDLDEIYMMATQLLTQSGGWPNSVFLTHELKPFFAGTYFPPNDWHGRPGFPRVLAAIREAWSERRESVREQADAVAQAIRDQLSAAEPGELPDAEEAVTAARASLARRFDSEWGGFGEAPKFPSPSNLFFLLDLARDGEARAREMLVTTLDGMARGGIHDQLAGGFHRYSTDAQWLVPHFEKMLYDNAALATLYAESVGMAPGRGFERVSRMTLDFVLREMTDPEGGFCSAIDAETDGHEGAYYSWTRDELKSLLNEDEFALLASVYGFEGRPNFEGSRYVLHLPMPLRERARALRYREEELRERLEPARKRLLEARSQRKRPLTDDKVLADWNGMMIGAMARAGQLLQEKRYVDAAVRAADFVLARLRDGEQKSLLHSYRAGVAKVPAMLDDYAFLIQGLLSLHRAAGERRFRDAALSLQAEQDRRLADGEAGGYFAAGEDKSLLFRAKPGYDGAVASGNGIAAVNLLELSRVTGVGAYSERLESLLRAFGRGIASHPMAHMTLVTALRRFGTAGAPTRAATHRRSMPASESEQVVSVHVDLGEAQAEGWRPLTLELRVRDGWHVNANPASDSALVPTEIRAVRGELRGVRYPEGAPLEAAPGALAVRVYSGRVAIGAEVRGDDATLALAYQPCDDKRCLAPVTREIRLRPESSSAS
jgi:uncharacterized protein YyaL (SSP411 family)